MNRLQKVVLLTEFITQLRNHGGLCNSNYVQRAVYFLQEIFHTELDFKYILYKGNPYSFDLEEELVRLQADYLIELDHRSPGYGPSLVPTKNSEELRSRFPKTITYYKPQLEFIAEKFGTKSIAELNKLAIALWVTKELGTESNESQRAKRVCQLKPGICFSDALLSVHELDQIIKNMNNMFVIK